MGDEKLPPAVERIRARGRARGPLPESTTEILPELRQLSMRRQAEEITSRLPQGEMALMQVENGLGQLMEDEPFWPGAHLNDIDAPAMSPAGGALGWFTGHGDDPSRDEEP